ncbi:MAG: DUF4234 domain-containing protein [Clostridia bacterium]|nr:DUF4234 domain-containing protein [Clostridia bacterium]
MIKEKNVVLAIVLSIVTCGIYGLYWFVTITDETNQLTNSQLASGVMALVLTIVTCGIYGFYWAYKLGEKVDMLKQQRGEAPSSSPVLFLILQIFGLGIINYVLAQLELNKFAQPAA